MMNSTRQIPWQRSTTCLQEQDKDPNVEFSTSTGSLIDSAKQFYFQKEHELNIDIEAPTLRLYEEDVPVPRLLKFIRRLDNYIYSK